MASAVDICNLALSHVADEAEVTAIDPPDGSVAADHCARFYPIARDELLEMHDWRFATFREVLALLAENPVNHWAYAYALPSNCLRPIAVLLPESNDDTKTQPYAVESLSDGSAVVYTNVEDAVMKFVKRVTDTSKFTPLFVGALAKRMAAPLAGVIPKDLKLKRALMQEFLLEDFPRAAAADANVGQGHPYGNNQHVPDFIAARR